MKSVVLAGAPLEQQTLYGPFDDHEAAVAWADDQGFAYSYVITLHDPPSTQHRMTPPPSKPAERMFAFGKYRGQSIKAIIHTNPQYIRWVYDSVANHGGLTEAEYRAAGGVPAQKAPRVPDHRPFGSYHDDFPDDDIPF